KLLSVSAASIMMLGLLAGCTQDSEPSNTNNGGGDVSTGAPSTMGEEQQSQAEEIKVKDFELENKELTFLAAWSRNPANGKNKDVALELFQTRFGGKINDVTVADAERFTTLASMVSTGQSPDFFSAGDMDAFPRGATAKMFASLDDIIDFNDEWFGSKKEFNDPFVFNGKHYAAVIGPEIDALIVYNQSIIEENNLADPAELLKENKWDWDNFYTMMADFCSKGENRYGVDGWWVAKGLSNSSGVPFIGMENGKVVNNVRDGSIEKAQALLEKLFNENIAFPLASNELGEWKSAPKYVGEGKTLFYTVGYWALTEVNTEYGLKNYGDINDVRFIPVPCEPGSDKVYIPARVNGYMLCAGAPNPQGFAALMYCEAAASGSDAAEQITKDQYFNEYGWTDNMWDMRNTMFKMVRENPVYDFMGGVSADCYDALNNPSKDSFHAGSSWVQTRETIYDRVQLEVDSVNKAAEEG
ncbi:MAG: ABC transporter substrate-binding protein, partial [Ruminiclostridium sp.]|nr:ABC transporter substrate-binding protein [Ruminiclostridium sp.]